MRDRQNSDVRDTWFGKVPADWSVLKAKRVFRLINKKVGEKHSNYDLLSLTLRGVIKRDIESGKGKFPDSFETYQEVKEGDLVFCLFDIDETPRTVGLSKLEGMITGAYSIFRCNENVEPRFINYFYFSIDGRKGLKPFYTGLRKVVRTDTFLNATVPVPALSTQQTIADFLDRETARIDLLIEKKLRLVALLKKKRQLEIVSAITLGLSSDAELRETNIDWFPKVPAHWDLRRVKHVGRCIMGLTYSPDDIVQEGEGYPVLRANNIKDGKLNNNNFVYVSSKIPKKLMLRENDILICSRNGSRNLIGKNALVDEQFSGMSFGAFTTVLRTKFSNYMYWILQSPIFENQAGSFLTSTINQLTISTLSNIVIPFAPAPEQDAICKKLNERERRFLEISRFLNQSIDRLREYRSALITAAVTGQIDVAEWTRKGFADRQLDALQAEIEA